MQRGRAIWTGITVLVIAAAVLITIADFSLGVTVVAWIVAFAVVVAVVTIVQKPSSPPES